VHQRSGDNKSAINVYKSILEFKPDDFDSNFNAGKLMALTSEKSEKSKAVAYLEKAQKLNSVDVRTYEQLIKLYKELKKDDKVAEQETALKGLKGTK
jgi:hypothetical protein